MVEKIHTPKYFIYDGRYRFDEERAIILCTADSEAEAKSMAKEQGDAVIVDSETGEIIE